MRTLQLVGLSEDGRLVILADDTGAEFATPADDRLRAALRGDRARLGQLEIEMDSLLRPRDIQARIRAGDSPETVAALAQTTVDTIMPYCIPVLAERQHITELARRSHVRRKGAEGPSRSLGDVVAERLQGRGVDALAAEWDAWRQEDGRWAVQATYHSGERERSALFLYDAVGRYSLAQDDEAKWLTGERQSTSKGPQPREGGRSSERRLTAVADADDLLSLPGDDKESDEATDDLTAVVRAVREEPQGAADETGPAPQPDEDGRAEDPAEASSGSFLDEALGRPDEPAAKESPAIEPTPERKRRTKRASVPSWDEIMFGGGKDES